MYFDVLQRVMFVYAQSSQNVIGTLVTIMALLSSLPQLRRHVLLALLASSVIGWSCGRPSRAPPCAGLATPLAVAALNMAIGAHMNWFTHTMVLVPLYALVRRMAGVPSLTTRSPPPLHFLAPSRICRAASAT